MLGAALLIVIAALTVAIAWRVTGWADVSTWPATPCDAAPDPAIAAQVEAPIAAPAIIRRTARPGVVLVHGLFGFDSIVLGSARIDYFRRVGQRLEAHGYDVAAVRLPPIGCVPTRAAALARAVAALPHDRFAIVAHSMGGLDARWALTRGDLAARVEALITIGTPHRGTPLADLLALRPVQRARAMMARLGLTSAALDWLTTWRWAELNAELVDVAGVRYGSVIAATADRARVHPMLRVSHAYLARAAGPSDGVVPGASQRWGAPVAEVEMDHWAQVGWSGDHDAGQVIADALARLRGLPPAPLVPALTTGA